MMTGLNRLLSYLALQCPATATSPSVTLEHRDYQGALLQVRIELIHAGLTASPETNCQGAPVLLEPRVHPARSTGTSLGYKEAPAWVELLRLVVVSLEVNPGQFWDG